MAGVFAMLSRLCLSAWVGVASFFVVVIISLRGSPLFSDETKLAHPKVLFPLFYTFEFALLGIALGAGLFADRLSSSRRRHIRISLALVASALLLGLGDYFAIYRPLAAMIEMPIRPPGFTPYHEWSRWLNMANLLVCITAGGMMLWPEGTEKPSPSPDAGEAKRPISNAHK
jgi:hypothetical protein